MAFFLVLCFSQLTFQFKYTNIKQDTLTVPDETIDSTTFNNVSLRRLTLEKARSISTLSGLNTVKIIDLPSTLTSISTNGFESLTDLEFVMPNRSDNIFIKDNMLIMGEFGDFTIIRYFGKRDLLQINFSCKIVNYAFDIHDFYVNRLELGSISRSDLYIYLGMQPIIFPSVLTYNYELVRKNKPNCTRLYISPNGFYIDYFHLFNASELFIFSPNKAISRFDLEPIEDMYYEKIAEKPDTLGFTDNITSITGKLTKLPFIKHVIFEGNTSISFNIDFFDTSSVETISFTNRTYDFNESFLAYVNQPVQVELQSFLTTFPPRLYEQAMSPSSLTLGSNIDTIGTKAFYNCATLESVSLPSTVKTIQLMAFAGCKNLKTINLNSVKTIEYFGFARCLSLKSISLQNCLHLGNDSFYKCWNITSVSLNLPNAEIGIRIFEGCRGLVS